MQDAFSIFWAGPPWPGEGGADLARFARLTQAGKSARQSAQAS